MLLLQKRIERRTFYNKLLLNPNCPNEAYKSYSRCYNLCTRRQMKEKCFSRSKCFFLNKFLKWTTDETCNVSLYCLLGSNTDHQNIPRKRWINCRITSLQVAHCLLGSGETIMEINVEVNDFLKIPSAKISKYFRKKQFF